MAKPKTSFIARIWNSSRFSASWIEVLTNGFDDQGESLIEIVVRKDLHMVAISLTPKEGEEVVEALKKAIEQLKEAATPKGDPT